MDRAGKAQPGKARRPSQDREIERISEQTGLPKSEVIQLSTIFARMEQQRVINRFEVNDVLRDMSIHIDDRVTHRLNEELQKREIRKTVDFATICDIYSVIKSFVSDEEDDVNLEYLDAFVALGGSPDRQGTVLKDHIIQTLRNEFELQIDIQELLEQLLDEHSKNELTWDEFVMLFETQIEDTKSRASFISYISQKAQGQGSRDSAGGSSFHVRYKDFEKWLDHYYKQ